ncbi:MAG: hypothetical protein Q9M36_01965, partial [Sulfurovum sp.]|nr:hypothetical protein [Sulfurovum sp.]
VGNKKLQWLCLEDFFVVSYAILFVWKIERSGRENAPAVRKFLVQLSGRLIEKNKEFTTPAYYQVFGFL